MIFLRGDSVVLLSCEEEMSASYTLHQPAAAQFTVVHPYQAPSTHYGNGPDAFVDQQAAETDALIAVKASSGTAPAAASSLAANRSGAQSNTDQQQSLEHEVPRETFDARLQQSEDAADGEHTPQQRKRKRRQRAYRPNAQGGDVEEMFMQEQQAEARHAVYQPVLAAAAAAMAAWLAASGSSSIAAALAAAGSTDVAAEYSSTRAVGPGVSANGTLQGSPVLQVAPDADAATDSSQVAAADNDTDASAADGADYIALAAMKGTLRPKFRFTNSDTAGATAALNLFDQLISHDGDTEAEAVAHETPVLLPPRSRFLMSDITRLKPLLPGTPEERYHLMVLDPPWENASARRAWRYPTLPSRNLLAIPMRRLLQPDGLVALWMTNRERHWRFVETELLPVWGLAPVATWLWLKVADDGRPVTPLDVAHRRPYEVLLLAAPARDAATAQLQDGAAASAAGSDSSGGRGGVAAAEITGLQDHHAAEPAAAAAPDAKGQPPPESPPGAEADQQQQAPQLPPPQHLVVAAVPGEHSRKPQLGRLLLRHVPQGGRCLEMFARELAAGWTSWGNEPLRFQAALRFQRVTKPASKPTQQPT